MPNKKPPGAPPSAAKPSTRPQPRRTTSPAANAGARPDNRWQRTKRYCWDSR